MSEKTYTSVLHVEIGGAVLPDKIAALLVEGWVDAERQGARPRSSSPSATAAPTSSRPSRR